MNLGNRTISNAYFIYRQKNGLETTEIHTDANDEAGNAYASYDILDEVGLARTNKCSSLTVMFVIVARSRNSVDSSLAFTYFPNSGTTYNGIMGNLVSHSA